jgi:transposase
MRGIWWVRPKAELRHFERELLEKENLRQRHAFDLEKVGRPIRRWQGRYPAAAMLLEEKFLKDEKGNAVGLELSCGLEKGSQVDLSKGAYLLRTNCLEKDPAQLWRWYIQFTEAEAAFRTAKSDIGLRPIYHQKTERVKAHLLVCFLSLALWRSLEMWMRSKGLGSNTRKLIEAVGTIRSMDVVVPVKCDGEVVEAQVRTVAKPEEEAAVLLAHFGLHLPKRSKIVKNVVKKNY